MSNQRLKRLAKIRHAQSDLESALLTLRDHHQVKWANDCFPNLYYLIRLARKAP